MPTRIEQFQRNARSQKFISVIGHGTLIHPGNTLFNGTPFFQVPEGVSIIFISRPGYWIPLRALHDDNMLSLLHSERKLQRLIAGTLSAEETPIIIKRAAWNWKNHIYTPGMYCPNMGFELYDNAQTRWGVWYNQQCGVYYPGANNSGLSYKGKKGTLMNLISSLHKKGIIVVFGCRGDPSVYHNTRTAFNRFGRSAGRVQNYSIPRTILTTAVQHRENEARRYLTVKRVRSVNNLRRQNNVRSGKRYKKSQL